MRKGLQESRRGLKKRGENRFVGGRNKLEETKQNKFAKN